MRLTDNERDKLLAAMQEAYPTYDKLDAMVYQGLQQNLQDLIRVVGVDLNVMRADLIRWAEGQDRVGDLLNAATKGNAGNTLLAACAQELKASLAQRSAPSAVLMVDPFETCVVQANQSFINRKELRKALHALHTESTPWVLTVTGPERSGKSYSLQLIQFLQDHLPECHVIPFDRELLPQPISFGPAELARTIVWKLPDVDRPEVPEQEMLQPARWIQKLGDWIMAYVTNSGRKVWIVLDGFEHSTIPDDTRELIRYLIVTAILDPAKKLRVILLDYKEQMVKPMVPPKLSAYVKRDSARPLNRGDLLPFVDKIVHHRGHTSSPEELEATVDEVLAKVPPASNDYNSELVATLMAALDLLFPEEAE